MKRHERINSRRTGGLRLVLPLRDGDPAVVQSRCYVVALTGEAQKHKCPGDWLSLQGILITRANMNVGIKLKPASET